MTAPDETPGDTTGWDDPDRAVQIEDDNPETLAGDECEEPDAGDGNPPAAAATADDAGEAV